MSKVKLLFLFPNLVMQNPPPVSIAIFHALLKGENVEMKIFDTTLYGVEAVSSDKTKENNLQVQPFDFGDRGVKLKTSDVFDDFREMVSDFSPDLIAFSCNEITFSQGYSLLERLEDYKGIVIAGGVYPTFAPEEVIKLDKIDIVCVGEGEQIILDLVKKMSRNEAFDDLPNTYVKKQNTGKVKINSLCAPVDLDELPVPDYKIFDENRYFRPMAGKIWKLFPIETSRGCPYRCSYCNSPVQKKIYSDCGFNNFFRKKSIKKIEEELTILVEEYGAEYIYFLSDTLLCMKESEFEQFCKMYSKFSLPFWCQNRPEMVSYERMRALKEIGCCRMSIGVEHGNEEFRKKKLLKNVSNSVIIEAFDILHEVDIPTTVNNIIGFPGENRSLAFDTIELNRKLKFASTNAYAFTPFIGTPLYDECISKGYIKKNTELHSAVTKGTIMNMPGFTKTEIDGLLKTFVLYTRLPEKYFSQIKIAESDTDEGRKTFVELVKIYKKLLSTGSG